MIINEVFGEIEFDYTWSKDEEIIFNDKKEALNVAKDLFSNPYYLTGINPDE